MLPIRNDSYCKVTYLHYLIIDICHIQGGQHASLLMCCVLGDRRIPVNDVDALNGCMGKKYGRRLRELGGYNLL